MKQLGLRRESFHYSHARRGKLRIIPVGLAVVLSATRLERDILRFVLASFSLSWAGRGRDPTSSP